MSASRPVWTRVWPQGLAGRFALLLAGALIAVNLAAIALVSSERQRLGRAFEEEGQIQRLASLVPLIAAVPPQERPRLAGLASDRFVRVSVGPAPLVPAERSDPRAVALARASLAELGATLAEVRVALTRASPDRAPPRGAGRPRPDRVVLSVGLAPAEAVPATPQWLNISARAPRQPPRADPAPILTGLLLSLGAVLAVGLVFIRRLTRPLAALASAARAAGRGDRTARVPETGARELREAARAFNEMQAQIARFDAERTRTLAAVGHDLRTPITSLRIRAELLDDADRVPIVRTLDAMAVMAEGLVAYARGQADAETPATLDLAALVARLCEERGADFAGGPPVHVTGRAVALARALGNLVDNALRYGGAARVRLAVEDGTAVVRVEDDGPGIAPERIETLFEPFVRGDASRSLDTGGAGLGLSIARSILRAHGGEVTLANRPGGGLVASARLPILRQPGGG